MSKYTYSIIAYLNLLGDFDQKRIKEIEDRLLVSLSAAGISNSRYERLKYSRNGLSMKMEESNILFDFFHDRFLAKAKATDDVREKQRINAWAPKSLNDLYYSPEAIRVGL